MTDIKKNELIAQLESAVEDAQTGAGVASLAEIETEVAALRTACTADPATVTETALVAARTKIEGCNFGSIESSSSEWAEAIAAAE